MWILHMYTALSLIAGFLCLLLCDEFPQLDRHIHPSGICQGKASTPLCYTLAWGWEIFCFHALQTACAENWWFHCFILFCFAVFFLMLVQLKNKHPDIKLKYLAEYCFSGTYIITLLTEGYNFTSETYSTIEFIKKVSSSPWAQAHFDSGHILLTFNFLCRVVFV